MKGRNKWYQPFAGIRLRPKAFRARRWGIPLAELQQVVRESGRPLTSPPVWQIHVVVPAGLLPTWTVSGNFIGGSWFLSFEAAREAFDARIGETTAREAVN